jgi:uncharacterized protein (TIGR02246 family)
MWLGLALAAAVAASPNALLAGYRTAWDRADARALADFYTADGALQTPYGVRAKGARAIREFYAGAFARGYAGSRGEASLDRVTPLSASLALARGHWSIRGAHEPAGGARKPECGELTAVLRRETGGRGWRILALDEFAGTCPATP